MKILQSSVFEKWLLSLKDAKIKAMIVRRLENIVASGHLGDFKSIEGELKELRFFNRSGVRIYFALRGNILIILLNGGTKSSQKRDIIKAKELLKEFDDEKI